MKFFNKVYSFIIIIIIFIIKNNFFLLLDGIKEEREDQKAVRPRGQFMNCKRDVAGGRCVSRVNCDAFESICDGSCEDPDYVCCTSDHCA